jgi:hypothetical protein
LDILHHPDIPQDVYEVLFDPSSSKHITPNLLLEDVSVQNMMNSVEPNKMPTLRRKTPRKFAKSTAGVNNLVGSIERLASHT